MFYDCVKTALQAGQVRVGLPPFGHEDIGDSLARIEAGGLVGLKAKFLSRRERRNLVHLVMCESGQRERELPIAMIQQWMGDRRAVLVTGRCGVGKTWLLSVALPDAVFVSGRTSDVTKPHWFWHQITQDPSRPLVIDEPWSFPPLVFEELLKVVKAQGRGYVVINQAEEGSRFESLVQEMTPAPFDDAPGAEIKFTWVRLRSFKGAVALAKWTGKYDGAQLIAIQNPYDSTQVIALDTLLDLIDENLKVIDSCAEPDMTRTELLNLMLDRMTDATERKMLFDAICNRFVGE